jgi:aconitate hydratase
MDVDLYNEPLAHDPSGRPVYLRELWPTQEEIQAAVRNSVRAEMFQEKYAHVFAGDERWNAMDVPTGDLFAWDPDSTYVKNPPFFDNMPLTPLALENIHAARVLALLGDSITTDHISPAGSIPVSSPAGKYLIERSVDPKDFNSYGARRGNHEVMMRGTFANIRLRNLLVPGIEGGWTVHLPDGGETSIFEAAMQYQEEGVPLIVIAGKEYGTGSSRDWAAKGTRLLGVRAVVAESFERIHRSNLLGMGVLPLQFKEGESHDTLGLTGFECYEIEGISKGLKPGIDLTVRANNNNGSEKVFTVIARIDTPEEVAYYQHGGILPYVLRQMLQDEPAA